MDKRIAQNTLSSIPNCHNISLNEWLNFGPIPFQKATNPQPLLSHQKAPIPNFIHISFNWPIICAYKMLINFPQLKAIIIIILANIALPSFQQSSRGCQHIKFIRFTAPFIPPSSSREMLCAKNLCVCVGLAKSLPHHRLHPRVPARVRKHVCSFGRAGYPFNVHTFSRPNPSSIFFASSANQAVPLPPKMMFRREGALKSLEGPATQHPGVLAFCVYSLPAVGQIVAHSALRLTDGSPLPSSPDPLGLTITAIPHSSDLPPYSLFLSPFSILPSDSEPLPILFPFYIFLILFVDIIVWRGRCGVRWSGRRGGSANNSRLLTTSPLLLAFLHC
jgi:hypothetical protein